MFIWHADCWRGILDGMRAGGYSGAAARRVAELVEDAQVEASPAMLCVTQEGALALWRQILGIAPGISYPFVHLYTANYTPQHTDTYATYAAIELAAPGYAPISLINPSVDWTLAAIGAGAQASYVTLTWALTGAATIWGYWLADATETHSLWAEQFATSFVYGSSGGSFSLQLIPWLASHPDVAGIPCTSP